MCTEHSLESVCVYGALLRVSVCVYGALVRVCMCVHGALSVCVCVCGALFREHPFDGGFHAAG